MRARPGWVDVGGPGWRFLAARNWEPFLPTPQPPRPVALVIQRCLHPYGPLHLDRDRSPGGSRAVATLTATNPLASFSKTWLVGSCLQSLRRSSFLSPSLPLPTPRVSLLLWLLSLGTSISAAISMSSHFPASAIPQVSTRLAVHLSVPPEAGTDHAQRLPLPKSCVPAVHPGGNQPACRR